MDYNARWYSPSLGRFTQPDTIIPDFTVPQTLNRYSYVANNPINLTDPTGHKMEGECGYGGDDYCKVHDDPVEDDLDEDDLCEINPAHTGCNGNGNGNGNGSSSSSGTGNDIPDSHEAAVEFGACFYCHVQTNHYGALTNAELASLQNQMLTTAGYGYTMMGGIVVGGVGCAMIGIGPCASTVETAACADGDCFDEAGDFSVGGYNFLRNLFRGSGRQTHHLIEQRFAPALQQSSTGNWPSVSLTPAQHQVFTNAWRATISYSNSSSGVTTLNATPAQISAAAQQIYANYPTLLNAANQTPGLFP